MPFKEIIAVYSENHTEPIHTKYGVTECQDSCDIWLSPGCNKRLIDYVLDSHCLVPGRARNPSVLHHIQRILTLLSNGHWGLFSWTEDRRLASSCQRRVSRRPEACLREPAVRILGAGVTAMCDVTSRDSSYLYSERNFVSASGCQRLVWRPDARWRPKAQIIRFWSTCVNTDCSWKCAVFPVLDFVLFDNSASYVLRNHSRAVDK
jgi:hypothetical protein